MLSYVVLSVKSKPCMLQKSTNSSPLAFLRSLQYLPMLGFLTLLFPIFELKLPAVNTMLDDFVPLVIMYLIHYTYPEILFYLFGDVESVGHKQLLLLWCWICLFVFEDSG